MRALPVAMFIALSCAATVAHTQTFQRESAGIPVTIESRLLERPWNGGLFDFGIAMTDIDSDGDQDLFFTGRSEGRISFYRNDGQGNLGLFTFADSAAGGISLGDQTNRLGFDDIDGDGDKDLFVGQVDGRLWVYTNLGDSSAPLFSNTATWVDSIDVGFQAAPGFGDLDDDGRIDLLVGSYDQGILYFRRAQGGSHTYVLADTLRDTTGTRITTAASTVPALADIDGDGDLDLFIGNTSSLVGSYINVGSASDARFVEDNTLNLVTPPDLSFLIPVFADIDGDIDLDLFLGSNRAWISFSRNTGTPTVPVFTLVTRHILTHYLDFGSYAAPSFVDIDGDQDLDFFVGKSDSGLAFFRNIGTPSGPRFDFVTDRYAGITGGMIGRPSWGDLDDDGDPDLILGTSQDGIFYCHNGGTAGSPSLSLVGLIRDTANATLLGWNPVLADLDGDADLDILTVVETPTSATAMLLYRNAGTPAPPRFVLEDTLRDAGGSIISEYDLYANVADFDRDGQADLFIGNSDGVILYYRNTAAGPGFSFELQTQNFGGVNNGSNYRCLPVLADLDGDNDLDIVVGQMHGGFYFYRNTTPAVAVNTTTVPVPVTYALEQNYPNPFNPVTVVRYLLPVTIDVRLSVYDILGREVSVLVSERRDAGIHEVEFDGTEFASGTYFCRLEAGAFVQTRQLMLLK
ncbi:MAG: FG-GAP-like repeat-containing protein [Bacteroidota bacterium]